MIMTILRFMYKYEFAQLIGISRDTLRRIINKESFDDLIKIGYSRHAKMLSPRQMTFIKEKYGYEG